MTKAEIINAIIGEMQAAAASQKAERDAAYFRALSNAEFARTEREFRELTARGVNSDALKRVAARRNALFAKFCTTPKQPAVCSRCLGVGYVKGKLCSCVQKRYTQKLIAQSGFTLSAPKGFDDKLLSKFSDANIRASYKKIYSALAQYCEKFPNTAKKNIVLSGGTGTGKTFAAAIIANNLMERGFSVLYLTAFSLVQRFKSYIQNDFATRGDTSALDDLLDADLLVIDDLGTEPTIRNITQEYIYNIINERLVAGRAFIVTTNLDIDELDERYDKRIASRLLSRETTAVIEMKGPDLRNT